MIRECFHLCICLCSPSPYSKTPIHVRFQKVPPYLLLCKQMFPWTPLWNWTWISWILIGPRQITIFFSFISFFFSFWPIKYEHKEKSKCQDFGLRGDFICLAKKEDENEPLHFLSETIMLDLWKCRNYFKPSLFWINSKKLVS